MKTAWTDLLSEPQDGCFVCDATKATDAVYQPDFGAYPWTAWCVCGAPAAAHSSGHPHVTWQPNAPLGSKRSTDDMICMGFSLLTVSRVLPELQEIEESLR